MPTNRTSILVCDDEPLIRDTLAEFLAQEGFIVEVVGRGEDSVKRIGERYFDIVFCDINLPGIDGLDTMKRILSVSPETFVILITAYGTVENAVEAFQHGAADFLMKPIMLDEVLNKVRRLTKLRELSLENQLLRRQLNRVEPSDFVVGSSVAMVKLFELAKRVAPTKSTVLIQGDSGTGKEVLARYIHDHSTGGSRYLPLNCAAIPNDLLENQLFGHRKGAFTGADRDQAGMFVHAGDGTVFLDEIAEMALPTQAKLLRAIEQKEILPVGANEPLKVEARILAATNKDLKKEVEAGKFREDLYYRLNVVTLKVPALAERREDIPALVEFLLTKHAKSLNKRFDGVTHEAMTILMACPWKGNVRELDNAIQRAVILGDGPMIKPLDLPPDMTLMTDDPQLVDDLAVAIRRFERRHIERLLRQSADKREAAKRLNIGLSSLYRKIDDLQIESGE